MRNGTLEKKKDIAIGSRSGVSLDMKLHMLIGWMQSHMT